MYCFYIAALAQQMALVWGGIQSLTPRSGEYYAAFMPYCKYRNDSEVEL